MRTCAGAQRACPNRDALVSQHAALGCEPLEADSDEPAADDDEEAWDDDDDDDDDNGDNDDNDDNDESGVVFRAVRFSETLS